MMKDPEISKKGKGDMIFVGIDPSLIASAVISLSSLSGSSECKENGTVIKTTATSHKTPFERVRYIVRKIVSSLSPSTTLVAIEEPFIGHGNNAMILAALAFDIRTSLHRQGFPFFSPAAVQVKKFVCGGGAKKDMIMKEVLKRWGYDAKTNDEADAYAMARLAEGYYRLMTGGAISDYTIPQREVLEKQRNNFGYNLPWVDGGVQNKPKKKRRSKTTA